ncbi:phosphatase PAP2 family protein [Paenibacillus puldeungensis]|uniref:Phosphatase PAP2 family protein n=1 Tax=Paenibacillus puldeungensis TaxID=696536 RepID=A0ABW3RZE9_9BACL
MKADRVRWQTEKYWLASALILSFFVIIFTHFADELMEQKLFLFDHTIIDLVQGLISPRLTTVMKLFTFLGSTTALVVVLFISVTLMIRQKKRWEALFLVIAISGGVLFNQWLKWLFHRQRPTLHRLIEETGYSFPSGHSMVSFVFYGMLGVLVYMFLVSKLPKIILTFSIAFLIIMIGISRIYLGVHYPSDVIAGFSAGGAWLVICLFSLRLILLYRGTNTSANK